VLATLEGRGLVARERSADDGRLVLVRLSAKGRRLMASLFPKFNGEERFVVSGIPVRSRGAAADALRRLTVTASEDVD